jgi:hypothetical protein
MKLQLSTMINPYGPRVTNPEAIKVALHAIIPEEERLPKSCCRHAVAPGASGEDDAPAAPRISLLKRKADEELKVGSKLRKTRSWSSNIYYLSSVFLGPTTGALCDDDDDQQPNDDDPLISDGGKFLSSSADLRMTTSTSLEFQLNYVAPDDALGTCEAAPCIIFPNLPTAISSDSSWSTSIRLKRAMSSSSSSEEAKSDTDVEEEETDPNERYGWFVVLDKDICDPRTGCSAYKSTVDDLAFSASTAPIPRGQEELAELEWAQAADTVDDLLGDLF